MAVASQKMTLQEMDGVPGQPYPATRKGRKKSLRSSSDNDGNHNTERRILQAGRIQAILPMQKDTSCFPFAHKKGRT
jgi:hypothetical protein